MKFVVDGMLGSLARWLRMLGYDTQYDSRTSDNDLLNIAIRENRILLTRDQELYNRAKSKSIFSLLVQGEEESERLGFLAETLQTSLDVNMATTRCPDCNGELGKVPKGSVRDIVPPATLERYDEYWRCHSCSKVYWVGSHWKQIQATLEKARKLSRERQD